MDLNDRAQRVAEAIAEDSPRLRTRVSASGRARVIDCGVATAGGLEVGRRVAEASLAGLGEVSFVPSAGGWDGPSVVVRTDHPLAACMAAQYAGWEVKGDDGYFAMGSGPMRTAAACEPIFQEPPLAAIAACESAAACVGVLEAASLPPDEVCQDLAEKCGVAVENLTLLVAPVTSQAGAVQVVARSIETAMHKLHELGFDLARIESGWGAAPLPPVASDTITGIGRTNDAVLYGAHAVLYVRGDDESLAEVGPRAPSSASAEHGAPFAEIFKRHGGDFYQIDPLLFSPAVVTFVNLDTGSSMRFGDFEPEVLAKSFGVTR